MMDRCPICGDELTTAGECSSLWRADEATRDRRLARAALVAQLAATLMLRERPDMNMDDYVDDARDLLAAAEKAEGL